MKKEISRESALAFKKYFKGQLNLLSTSVRYTKHGNFHCEISKNRFMDAVFYGVTLLYETPDGKLHRCLDLDKTFDTEKECEDYIKTLTEEDFKKWCC